MPHDDEGAWMFATLIARVLLACLIALALFFVAFAPFVVLALVLVAFIPRELPRLEGKRSKAADARPRMGKTGETNRPDHRARM